MNSHRDWAKHIFSLYGSEFHPVLVMEDDKFFIMDWCDRYGSGNLATRYIVDKKKGDFIIKGDSGYCIASWFNEVSPENIAVYINSIGYFIGKMKCTTNKFTYEHDNIKDDIEEIRKRYLEYLEEGDLENITEEELNEDFDEMFDILSGLNDCEQYPNDLCELFSKYNQDWWDGEFTNIGERIDPRVYQWVYGFQTGLEELRGKDIVRKE